MSAGSSRATLVALPTDPGDDGVSPFDDSDAHGRRAATLRRASVRAAASVEPGGVVAYYGAPEWVTLALAEAPVALEQRAWIAVAARPRSSGALARSHVMLALAVERGRPLSLTPLRAPHRTCVACGGPLRDWGGHDARRRPEGARLSDVWCDLDVALEDPLPESVRGRLARLLGLRAGDRISSVDAGDVGRVTPSIATEAREARPLSSSTVVPGDCLDVLRATASASVDLAFADPPYNLEKPYVASNDRRSEAEYTAWCRAWLAEYARVVRPGGTLAVLTLPRWAAAHARFLLRHRSLRFDRWVVWDALGEPKGGGLLPAHYALLLFTKGAARRSHAPLVADPSASHCRRASCAAARMPAGRVPLSDVWTDVPRVRHAHAREAHPCQLPRLLVERIVAVASPPGGVVLDAFCGTGTTGVAAHALARRASLSDVSPDYVAIARRRLQPSPNL